jgi:hypothetical protein
MQGMCKLRLGLLITGATVTYDGRNGKRKPSKGVMRQFLGGARISALREGEAVNPGCVRRTMG